MNSEEVKNQQDLGELWGGHSLQDALRDQQARALTGYSYEELKVEIAHGESLLDEGELDDVDKSVNVLGHMFKYYASKGL